MPERSSPVIERFTAEAQAYIDGALKELRDAQAEIEAISAGTKKANKATLKELHFRMEVAARNLSSNQEYLVRCLHERLEKMHAEAVTEFEAHVHHSLTKRGLDAMRSRAALAEGTGDGN